MPSWRLCICQRLRGGNASIAAVGGVGGFARGPTSARLGPRSEESALTRGSKTPCPHGGIVNDLGSPRAAIVAWIATAMVGLAGISLAGCGKGTSIGAAPVGAEEPTASDTLSGKQILQKGGLCSEDREVDDPDPDTDEFLIWRMYQLALAEDTEETFQSFRALFPEQRNTRELREMYWPRVRKNVDKFMLEPGSPAFRICRITPSDEGKKYFIQTNDPRQHPPPITIGESDGGQKKILALTPF